MTTAPWWAASLGAKYCSQILPRDKWDHLQEEGKFLTPARQLWAEAASESWYEWGTGNIEHRIKVKEPNHLKPPVENKMLLNEKHMNIVTIDFYNRDILMENSNDRKADLLKNSGNYYVICSDFMGFFFFYIFAIYV